MAAGSALAQTGWVERGDLPEPAGLFVLQTVCPPAAVQSSREMFRNEAAPALSAPTALTPARGGASYSASALRLRPARQSRAPPEAVTPGAGQT